MLNVAALPLDEPPVAVAELEDPERLAEVLVEFWRRNERVVVGIKKVGEA